MKTIKNIKPIICLVLGTAMFLNLGCERDISDDAVEALFPNTAEVYTDAPVGLTDEFFISFNPADGANPNGFGTDDDVAFLGSSSIRIDVPSPNDPDGGFIGGIFRDRGAGRNLTEYDALTFWARGSTTATIGLVGFGTDFIQDRFAVGLENIELSTDWRQYTIPIPDASKLVQEQGMFIFSAGTDSTNGFGYTFWMDEIRFETTGTIGQPRPVIFNGQDITQQTFIGANATVSGLVETFNLGSGQDATVNVASAYYTFSSSNPNVAIVDEAGVATVVGAGTTVITATLNGIEAAGSLTLESLGEFTPAPTPTRAQENVTSLFSDAYNNVPVDFFNGFFAPFQTTLGQDDISINGDNIISYTELNFVGIGTFINVPTLDITNRTHLHVDINVQEAIDPGDFIRLQIINNVGGNEISGDFTITGDQLLSNEWSGFDIPLADFTGLNSRDNVGLLFFISDATISNIYVDNVYYYTEVIEPTPNVDDSAATQIELPIGFEASLDYGIFGFEGADSAVEANPMPSGINPTNTVIRTTKTQGAQFFAGTVLNLDAPIDFSTSQRFRMKVLSPKTGIPIRVRLENADNSVGIELDANTTTMNEWEELEWDFSSMNTSANFVRVVVFFEFIVNLPGDGSVYYYDDIQILN